jgi:hypothetical protein
MLQLVALLIELTLLEYETSLLPVTLRKRILTVPQRKNDELILTMYVPAVHTNWFEESVTELPPSINMFVKLRVVHVFATVEPPFVPTDFESAIDQYNNGT